MLRLKLTQHASHLAVSTETERRPLQRLQRCIPLGNPTHPGLAVVDGVGVIDEGALDLGVSALTARSVVGRRLGRGAFKGRWIGRGGLGGVGGVLVEPLLEFSHLLVKLLKALLVALDKSQDGCLGVGRDLVPQLNRYRRNGRHTNILRPLEARTSSACERVPFNARGMQAIPPV